VVPDGYLWRESTYPSLSTIARAITGTAWNGPRFFGLRARRNHFEDAAPDPGQSAPRNSARSFGRARP
jgi:Protein of unknown function (DUF2924)